MDIEIPDTLLSQILDELGCEESADTTKLKAKLNDIAASYLADQSVVPQYPFAKAQKVKIEQLMRQAARLLATSKEISPEYEVALDCAAAFSRANDPDVRELNRLRKDLANLILGANLFLERFQANQGPRANIPLQEAIISLLKLMDGRGSSVEIARHKDSTGEAEMVSLGAKAISALLRGIDPKLSVTAIANMIDKVRAADLSPDPLDPLIEFQMDLELEGLLLAQGKAAD